MKQKKKPKPNRKPRKKPQPQNIHCEIQGKSDLLREMYCRHAESVRVFPICQIKILQADG